MASNQLNARVLWKRDTSANWTSHNPVLLNGEIIIVDTDIGETRFKIGDGTKTYTQLPFEDEAIRSLILNKSIPDYTSEDNGKFLRVLNGVASWVTVPNAEEGSF